MGLSRTAYRDYVFGHVDDRDRLVIQHRITKPAFVRNMQLALDDYGLAEKVLAGQPLKILDVGCSEGLFLHDVAELLDARGLRDRHNVSFYGIDRDESAILTATAYSLASKPPRPYFNFYVHDLNDSLETCQGLFVDGRKQFDLIILMTILEHLPNAQAHLAELYQYLAPGGVIYSRDLVLHAGEDGWISAHPASDPIAHALLGYLLAANKGIEVASEAEKWLQQLGGEQVQVFADKQLSGGNDQLGMDLLRNAVMAVRNAGPVLVAKGLLTHAQLDGIMEQMFRDIGPQSRGQLVFLDTLARKPI